jgi:hypothetical protein
MCNVLHFQTFFRSVRLAITQYLSGFRSGGQLSIPKSSVCFVFDVVTPAPVLSRHDTPSLTLLVQLLRTLLNSVDGIMRPAQEALPRGPDSDSDAGIRN